MKPAQYFQGVLTELKKVSWPTPATVGKYFFSVVIGLALASALIAAFDFIFIKGLGLIIK